MDDDHHSLLIALFGYVSLYMQWHKIPAADIPETDGIRKSRVGGKSLCIIRQGEQVYATGSTCPHAGADLAGGWCEAGQLVCPYHRHTFDLQTGRGAAGQGNYIRVYPTQQEPDGWYVGLVKKWWRSVWS